MIRVQMNIRIGCDRKECDSEVHFSEYLPLAVTEEEIMEAYQDNANFNSWRYDTRIEKVFCSSWCQERYNETD